ncbi:MAG: hypothetical protein K2O10_05740, partial [Muribaculaceae bacterium]|nr:hypothetical protein [Muribaculaceae bacterium]
MRKLMFLLAAAGYMATAATDASAQDEVTVVEQQSTDAIEMVNCKTQYSVDRGDNWFIQLGAGISVPMFENQLPEGQDARRHVTPTYNLGAGRWFSPYLGFRLSAFYGPWHWDNESYSKARFANLNFDFMWDMCNSLGGVSASRAVSVIPFVGLGGTYTWNIKSAGSNIHSKNGKIRNNSWTLPVSAGIHLRFRLCEYVDFFLERRASFYGDNVN